MYPPPRGLQRVPVLQSDRQLWSDEIRTADVAEGSRSVDHLARWPAGKLSPVSNTPVPAGHEQRCPAISRRWRTTAVSVVAISVLLRNRSLEIPF